MKTRRTGRFLDLMIEDARHQAGGFLAGLEGTIS